MRPLRQKGYSLVELLVGVAVSGLTILVAANLFNKAFQGLTESQRRFSLTSDQFLVQKRISQTLSISDIRLYALNGNNDYDNAFSRLLSPQPGLCANLASGGICDQSVAMVYANLARDYRTPVLGYCWVQKAKKLLVDNNVSALLSTPVGLNLVALIYPPAATVWSVASVSNVNLDASNNPDVPSDCYPYFDRDASNNYILSNRRIIDVSAFYHQNLGATVDDDIKIKMSQKFPILLQRVELYSMGLMPKTGVPGQADFVVRPCTVDASNNYTCLGVPLFHVEKIVSNRIVEFFKYSLPGDNNVVRYQLTGGPIGQMASCALPTCKPMPVANNSALPYAMAGETFEALDPANFTMMKQDVLRRIDVIMTDLNGKEFPMNVPLE